MDRNFSWSICRILKATGIDMCSKLTVVYMMDTTYSAISMRYYLSTNDCLQHIVILAYSR